MAEVWEPALTTDPSLARVLDELLAREPLFHRAELGTSRRDFERMMTADFWEVGASGRRYRRDYVLDVLEERHAQPHDDPWTVSDAHCRRLADETFLLTYTLRQDKRLSRRATVWIRSHDGWKAAFHQGTLVQDAAS